MTDELIKAIEDSASSSDYWIGDKVVDGHKKPFTDSLKNGSLSSSDAEKLIMVAIEHWNSRIINEFINKLLDRKKPIEWSKKAGFVESIIDGIHNKAREPKDDNKKGMDCSDFFEKFFKMLKINKLLPQMKPKLLGILLESFENASDGNLQIHTVGFGMIAHFPWKDDIEQIKEAFRAISQAVQSNPEICDGDIRYSLRVTTTYILQVFMTNTKKAKEILPEVTELVHFLKDQEWTSEDDSDKHTVAYEMLTSLMEDYLYRHHDIDGVLKPNMDVIKELWECGEETLERDANNIMSAIAGNAELLGDDSAMMIDRYLSGEDQTTITSFPELFKKKPDLFYEKIDELVDAMDGAAEWMAMSSMTLFWEMAKVKPQVFSDKHIQKFVSLLESQNAVHMAITTLGPIAEKCPEKVVPYDKELMDTMVRLGDTGAAIPGILVSMSKTSKEKAEEYLSFIWKAVGRASAMVKVGILWSFRQIAQAEPEIIKKYKSQLEEMKKLPELKESVQGLIDVMEGRSLEHLSKEVEEQKEDINELDERVTTNEQNISNIAEEVEDVQNDVRDVKWDVIEQEARIDDLEEVVDDTVDKVEEIDRKTLSHAPSWSRDVAKLLNPAQEHDWRLLSSRLGYATDDIKNWATQPDPCLSMLDEWFATHKTREATYAILKALQEMNRTDAAMIVENSLKNVEGIVVEDPPELVDPPPIFISYQWAHQPEVKLLNKHLEMAGFKSWMDIGQMGGGDKLFAKIDEGIRAAKVIICCVSEKYAQSPNCNREVNLSVTLGKPVIPLLMEKLTWPPPGTMGPIFSEYLFIRFFQREAEKTGDNRYWPADKFQELLMQLRYTVVPDDSIITEDYKGWWDPPEEMIVIKPKTDSQKNAATNKKSPPSTETTAVSPDVFISYQWGKQPQIKALYRRLTALGISCWFDIMQMGGGDSLYDKIDKGIRGCKVVISCVTTKYSLSANCRREVSLADATKKPIVPILLEKTAWPPEGPMAMVFTQLLYIDFTKPDVDIQNHWQCKQFEELLIKIGDSVPSFDSENAIGVPKDPAATVTKKDSPMTSKSDEDKEDTPPKTTPKTETVTPEPDVTRHSRQKSVTEETSSTSHNRDPEVIPSTSHTPGATNNNDNGSRKSVVLTTPKSSCCIIM